VTGCHASTTAADQLVLVMDVLKYLCWRIDDGCGTPLIRVAAVEVAEPHGDRFHAGSLAGRDIALVIGDLKAV
jgi:hypothetical protein